MMLRWGHITTVEIDHTHPVLPMTQIRAFHPLDFYDELLKKRPYLGCAAVLALKHPNPTLFDFFTDVKMAEIAGHIVNLEWLDPLSTIFVFDCSHHFNVDFRHIVFEWRKHDPKENAWGAKWTAHRILEKRKFRSNRLDDFCEADERLFKLLWEDQRKALASKSRKILSLNRSLRLLVIDDGTLDDFSIPSVCHLAIEIDRAQPGENFKPELFALCGAPGEWRRGAGKANEILRILKEDNRMIPYRLKNLLLRSTITVGSVFCKECELIGKLPAHRRRQVINKVNSDLI